MKKCFNIIMILLFSTTVFSQVKDSISLTDNRFYNHYEDGLYQTPLLYTQIPIENYTQTQIYYQYKELNFKRVQTAQRINQYNFITKGIYNFDKSLKVFGKVNIERNYEFDLGYNLSSNRTENQNVLSPNYYIAPKKANWENQKYNVEAGISKLFYKYFMIGATANYSVNKMFRKSDPRPELSIHEIGGKAHFGLNYNQHSVFGWAGLGQETQTNTIMYVNQWQNAPAYPDTYTRFSSGYGRIVNNRSFNSYLYRTISKSAGLGYQFIKDKNQLSIQYNYAKDIENLYEKDPDGNIYIDKNLITYKYKTVDHSFAIKHSHNGSIIDYFSEFKLNKTQGDNFSVLENGQNFRSKQNTYQFSSGIIKQVSKNIDWVIKLNASYSQQQYIDLLGFTKKDIDALETGISIGKDILSFKNRDQKIYLELDFNLYKPIEESLIYDGVSNTTFFRDGVILPDQAYDVTSHLNSRILLNYRMQLPKAKTLNIFVSFESKHALDDAYTKYDNALNTQLNKTIQMGISINY